MRWVVYIVAAIVLVGVIVTIIGAMLPKTHTASRSARIGMPPAALHALLVTKVSGPQEVPLRIERNEPPGLLVARVADPKLPFGGTWTYRIADAPGGSELTITEDGEVKNPIFRFMSKFVFGHYATMDAFLKALEPHAS
jgi:hypothetical protein